MVKQIELSQGKVALVDDEDFEYLNQWKWSTRKDGHTFYAIRNRYLGTINGKEKRKAIIMHRLIMNASEKTVVDHIDGNGLNNQKSNLRIVSHRQNLQNLHNVKKTSKYPGVSWNKEMNQWKAQVRHQNKDIYLGLFAEELDAAKAYEMACRELFGEELICKTGDVKS